MRSRAEGCARDRRERYERASRCLFRWSAVVSPLHAPSDKVRGPGFAWHRQRRPRLVGRRGATRPARPQAGCACFAPHLQQRPGAACSHRRAGALEHQAEFRPGDGSQRSTAALSPRQRGPAPSRPPVVGRGREALHTLYGCLLETTPELVQPAAARQARAGAPARVSVRQGSGRATGSGVVRLPSRCLSEEPPTPGLQATEAAAALADRLSACPLDALRGP